jgi:hypothetical protein
MCFYSTTYSTTYLTKKLGGDTGKLAFSPLASNKLALTSKAGGSAIETSGDGPVVVMGPGRPYDTVGFLGLCFLLCFLIF